MKTAGKWLLYFGVVFGVSAAASRFIYVPLGEKLGLY